MQSWFKCVLPVAEANDEQKYEDDARGIYNPFNVIRCFDSMCNHVLCHCSILAEGMERKCRHIAGAAPWLLLLLLLTQLYNFLCLQGGTGYLVRTKASRV